MSYQKDTIEIPADLFDWISAHQGSSNGIIELTNCIIKLNTNLVGRNKEPHTTEQKYPEMTKRFREITEEMYEVFLAKNNDYSRWNILATGIVGLTTRFWDKTSRIMNLVGFNIGTGEYNGPKVNLVEDEKIEQTFQDASVYGIIARIYLEGKWGK